ncbi:helix-turn-helix domain-containing protein [Singulisphaera rosea]
MVTGEGPTTEPWGRTVKVRKGVITSLRIEKGWRIEDLARKAICSVGTVTNCERGKPVLVVTVAKIAKALGVEVQSLLERDDQVAKDAPDAEKLSTGFIKLGAQFERFDETSDLLAIMEAVTKKFGPHRQIVVLYVSKGTVTIGLGFAGLEDLKTLGRLFCAYELDELGIFAVALQDYDGIIGDLVGWIFQGQPWVDFPPDSLREGLERLRDHPTAPNKFSYKFSSPKRTFFEVGFDPDTDRWILSGNVETEEQRIIPELRDLLKGDHADEGEE